jgi:uncharacterized protein with ParB-like and HNH nuclease domain
MKPSIQTLGQILYSPSQYVIPVFQRNYRWDTPQWAQLWESLIEIQRPEKRTNHFMGFLVFLPGLAQPGQYTTFHLIDGQQRLTTSCILLAAIRNVARRTNQAALGKEIHEYYLVHPLKRGEAQYRLLPKERDHESYISLITGQGQPAGRMAGALNYFEEQLSIYVADSPERLRQMFDTVCQRLEFMCATLEAENAYNIFKSLNSTGVPLGASDLIRNFVFMHIPPDEVDEFDRELWGPLENRFEKSNGMLDEERFSRFFRDFLMSSGRYVAPKDTFPAFEDRYIATNFSPKALAQALTVSAQHYKIISGQEQDQDPKVTQALIGLNRLESSTTYPILLALFDQRELETITSDQLANAINMLSGFILRRFICGESSRGYGQMFVRALPKESSDPVKALEIYLLNRGWPDDRRFIPAFKDFPLYLRGYAREVLETLELSSGHKEPADLMNTQVEHILPQMLTATWREMLGADYERIHTDWLHRPGNLTLSAYNPELWNHSFEKKRETYCKSHIDLTLELAKHERWTIVEIQERGHSLAENAAKIWVGPKVQTEVEEVETEKVDMNPNPRQLTGLQQLQLEYWQLFRDHVAKESKIIKARKAFPQQWTSAAIGSSQYSLVASMRGSDGYMSVELEISGPDAKSHFHLLHEQREEIERTVGETLNWYELPTKISSYVTIGRHDSPIKERERWPDQHKWLLEHMERFHRAFAERIKQIDSSPKRSGAMPTTADPASPPTPP